MPNLAIVLFAKNPYLSPVKTRLEKQTSKDFALSFYKKSLSTTIDLLLQINTKDYKSHLQIAVAEEGELNHIFWKDYIKVCQGSGALGKRLNKVYQNLIKDFDYVFFFGADSPFMSKKFLTVSIVNFIESDADFLMGPSLDGGFYIFGGKKNLDSSIWNQVQYSTNQTFTQLKRLVQDKGKLMEIDKHFDLDEKKDFYNMNLLKQDILTNKQKKLFAWIQDNLKL